MCRVMFRHARASSEWRRPGDADTCRTPFGGDGSIRSVTTANAPHTRALLDERAAWPPEPFEPTVDLDHTTYFRAVAAQAIADRDWSDAFKHHEEHAPGELTEYQPLRAPEDPTPEPYLSGFVIREKEFRVLRHEKRSPGGDPGFAIEKRVYTLPPASLKADVAMAILPKHRPLRLPRDVTLRGLDNDERLTAKQRSKARTQLLSGERDIALAQRALRLGPAPLTKAIVFLTVAAMARGSTLEECGKTLKRIGKPTAAQKQLRALVRELVATVWARVEHRAIAAALGVHRSTVYALMEPNEPLQPRQPKHTRAAKAEAEPARVGPLRARIATGEELAALRRDAQACQERQKCLRNAHRKLRADQRGQERNSAL